MQERPMTRSPVDPAATPEDPDAPNIAADDAGASAFAERARNRAADEAGDTPAGGADDA
jgi:hypothetical protein